MADPYASMNEQPREVQERIVEAMRLRAEEPEMQAMLDRYLDAVEVREGARALEIGCGAGAATHKLSKLSGVQAIVALDPSAVFLERAQQTLVDVSNVELRQGDARSLEFDDETFDLVLSHTVLCHVPDAEKAIAEAFRVLVPGGQLVVFDGDYATVNMALGDFDPLQCCVDAVVRNYVNDPWFMRRLPKMAEVAGFDVRHTEAHGYIKLKDAQYFETLIGRGADAIVAAGTIGAELANALKHEGQRRIREGQFYGVIMFGSLVACKPR